MFSPSIAAASRLFRRGFLSRRVRTCEWMDDSRADPRQLQQSLAYLRRINALLGYTRTTLGHLKRFSRRWNKGELIHILDIGTGSADVPRAILALAQRRDWNVRVVGLDLHARTISVAARVAGSDRLCLVRGDAMRLPFADRSFDYVICSLFLHHLSDEDAIAVLREMNRTARRGIIAADLLRNRRAYAWVKLLTLRANPMVRHDGPASVAQAFNHHEILTLRDAAQLHFASYYRHFGHRFVLAGEKVQQPPFPADV